MGQSPTREDRNRGRNHGHQQQNQRHAQPNQGQYQSNQSQNQHQQRQQHQSRRQFAAPPRNNYQSAPSSTRQEQPKITVMVELKQPPENQQASGQANYQSSNQPLPYYALQHVEPYNQPYYGGSSQCYGNLGQGPPPNQYYGNQNQNYGQQGQYQRGSHQGQFRGYNHNASRGRQNYNKRGRGNFRGRGRGRSKSNGKKSGRSSNSDSE